VNFLRKRKTFPEMSPEELECPNCKSGAVEVFADGILWSHDKCGAYGYYDDGERLFPDAQFRVKET